MPPRERQSGGEEKGEVKHEQQRWSNGGGGRAGEVEALFVEN